MEVTLGKNLAGGTNVGFTCCEYSLSKRDCCLQRLHCDFIGGKRVLYDSQGSRLKHLHHSFYLLLNLSVTNTKQEN